eukprot:385848-Amorphochlora_amoeboformis.AAC.1
MGTLDPKLNRLTLTVTLTLILLPGHWAQALTSTGAQRENQPCFGEDERGEGWERGWGEGCMRLLGGLDEGET